MHHEEDEHAHVHKHLQRMQSFADLWLSSDSNDPLPYVSSATTTTAAASAADFAAASGGEERLVGGRKGGGGDMVRHDSREADDEVSRDVGCVSPLSSKEYEETYRITHTCVRPAHCNTLQHTATHCNTLRHTATQCNTPVTHLQHTCNTEAHSALHTRAVSWRDRTASSQNSTAAHIATHTATHAATSQKKAFCVAVADVASSHGQETQRVGGVVESEDGVTVVRGRPKSAGLVLDHELPSTLGVM